MRFLPWMVRAFFENVPSGSLWRRLAVLGVAILGCFGTFSSLDGRYIFPWMADTFFLNDRDIL